MAAPATLYNEGAQRRQDRFDTRRLADRIAERLAEFEGAQCVVRVAVSQVFPNCPRYVHPMQRNGLSD